MTLLRESPWSWEKTALYKSFVHKKTGFNIGLFSQY